MTDPTPGLSQAQRLINRVMEDVGGSADAYETPIDSPANPEIDPVEEEISSIKVSRDDGTKAKLEAALEELPADFDEFCVNGLLEDLDLEPSPISEEYQFKAVVEEPDCKALRPIYEAFREAKKTNHPQEVELSSGLGIISPYMVMDQRGHVGAKAVQSWVLEDEVDNRTYRLDPHPESAADFIDNPTDILIWVYGLTGKPLGYIYEGYVYLRKGTA